MAKFQINDIVLDIAPEQIRIDRRTANSYWNTLRTRSSTKTRSGYSNIDIICTVKFTDTVAPGETKNGLQKLRALIAQIRCTPFCWVDNDFIRSSVLGNAGSEKAMVLALKNLEIHTVEGSVNTIEALLKFAWFNYAPFVKDYSYKEDVFLAKRVRDPRDSKAWKLMYEAELSKGIYQDLVHLQQDDNIVINTDEFTLVPLEQYKKARTELYAITEVQKALQKNLVHKYQASEFQHGIPDPLYRVLLESVNNDISTAEALGKEVLQNPATSVFAGGAKTVSAQQLLDFLKEAQEPRDVFVAEYRGLDTNATLMPTEWQVVTVPSIDDKGQLGNVPLQFSSVLDEKLDQAVKNQNNKKFQGQVLMRRNHNIDFKQMGLIPTSLSISFENILATMPLIGHPYPTFQHIGSIDGVVTISLATTNEQAVEAMSSLYTLTEDQARKARQVPAGKKNLVIKNGLINMCGLHETILEDMEIATVPGSPGTYQIRLTVVENPIEAFTQERLTPGTSFTTSTEIRLALMKAIAKHIKLNKDRIQISKGEIEIIADKTDWSKLIPSQKELAIMAALFTPTLGSSVLVGFTAIAADTLTNRYNGLYSYDGPVDEKNKLFAQLCTLYAVHLSQCLHQVMKAFNETTWGSMTAADKGKMYKQFPGFFLLTDDDIPEVGRLQQDVLDIISNPEIDAFKMLLDSSKEITIEKKEKRSAADSGMMGSAGRTVRDVDAWTKEDIELARSAVAIHNKMAQTGMEVPAEIRSAAMAELTQLRGGQQTIIAAFINDYLKEWHKWVIPFLDGLSRCSQLLTLPEFKEVQDLLKSNVLAQGADCYPDFPLDRVVSLMSNQSSTYRSLVDYLQDVATRNQLGFKNIRLSALLNPDFFMYTPLDAGVRDQMPFTAMQSARESILKSHVDDRPIAEESYLHTSYQALIGADKAADQKAASGARSRSMIEKDEKFWTSSGVNPEAKQAHDQLVRQRAGSVFEPDSLQGICGPSIYTSQALQRPISIQPIVDTTIRADETTKGGQGGIIATNMREASTLHATSYHQSVKHMFNAGEQLKDKSELAYRDPPKVSDPTKTIYRWPTEPELNERNITLGFSLVDANHRNGHKGIDLAAFGANLADARAKTMMHQVVAFADGKIIGVGAPNDLAKKTFVTLPNGSYQEISTAPVTVTIEHPNGYVSTYKHMQWDDFTQELWSVFHMGRSLSGRVLHEFEKESRLLVKRGDKIGMIGNTGFSTGPHLHFEVRPSKGAEPINPVPLILGEEYKSQGPLGWIDPNTESLFTKSVEQFDKELFTAQGYSMMRAYPTFKLYFIESDLGRRKRYAFDDFFGFSAVQDITVIKNRKIPADMCILKLTNISGVLSNRRWRESPEASKARDADGNIARKNEQNPSLVNTNRENSIASLMLQPGVQVQLRLGYTNNPDDLDRTFNGIITEVEFSGTDDTVEIVCQSYGIELVQNMYGTSKKYGGWFSDKGSTAPLLEDLMCAPEVVHFGRWEGGGAGTNTAYGLLSQRWKFTPDPQDDNIFAPQHPGNSFLAMGSILDDKPYSVFNTTIWDVFQEMTLRHPGYIAMAVPYEGKYDPARMTMFFGLPDQFYFARDPRDTENEIMSSIKAAHGEQEQAWDIVKKIVDPHATPDVIASIRNKLKGSSMSEDPVVAKLREFSIKNSLLQFAQDSGFIRPFRSYHVLTSTNHIMYNDVQSSLASTFNTITLNYSDGTPSVNSKTNELEFSDKQSFTMSVDAAIPDEDKREMFANYPNCIGFDLAKNYSIALLANSMREGYRGSIVIIGNPKIKPYDICYIFDEYTDMYGPVEVEQVVHRFSQENGFVTEITPNMCVHVNQMSTMTTQDAVGLMVEHKLRQMGMESLPSLIDSMIDKGPTAETNNQYNNRSIATSVTRQAASRVAGTAAVGLASAFFGPVGVVGGMLGLFTLRKYVTKAQTQQPLRYSPLTVQGMPMLGGIPARRLDGLFICGVYIGEGPSRWFKDTGRSLPLYADYVRERLYPNNWVSPVGEYW